MATKNPIPAAGELTNQFARFVSSGATRTRRSASGSLSGSWKRVPTWKGERLVILPLGLDWFTLSTDRKFWWLAGLSVVAGGLILWWTRDLRRSRRMVDTTRQSRATDPLTGPAAGEEKRVAVRKSRRSC